MLRYVISARTLALRTPLMAIAMTAIFLLSACGEKKEPYNGGNRDGAPTEKQTVTASSERSTEGAAVDGSKRAPISDVGLPLPGGPKDFSIPATAPVDKAGDTHKVTLNPQLSPAPNDTKPSSATAEKSTALKKSLTALPNYSGSAADNLVPYLISRANDYAHDNEERDRDFVAARSVLSANLVRKSSDGEVLLSLKFNEADGTRNYFFKGKLTAPNPSFLEAVSEVHGLTTNGKIQMLAKVKCLDANGKCENVLLNLKLGNSGSDGSVFIVFREAVANIYFDMPKEHSENPEYLKFRDFVIASSQKTTAVTRVQTASVKTFEVINGRAGFEAQIKTFDNEVMAFSGPLLAGSKTSPLDVPLQMNSKMKESLILAGLSDSKKNLATMFGSANLVGNNGEGVLEIGVTFRARGDFAQDTFRIRFTRLLNEVVALNDHTVN